MPERSVYDTRFLIEYFYSDDADFLRRLKEDLRAVRERMVSAVTVHEIHRINLDNNNFYIYYQILTDKM